MAQCDACKNPCMIFTAKAFDFSIVWIISRLNVLEPNTEIGKTIVIYWF